MSDFTSQDNPCGQALLSLVARGHAIISEINRMSEFVPEAIRFDPIYASERDKYGPILFDFRYIKMQEQYDAFIDSNPQLIDLDEEFRENHSSLLQRFYRLFVSVVRYSLDLMTFFDELESGAFVQYTTEVCYIIYFKQ